MSLSPHKRSTVHLATSTKPEHLLRSSRQNHDRHVSLAASLPSYDSSTSQVNTNGQAMFEDKAQNVAEQLDSIFTPSSPPVVMPRLRKASSSSQLQTGTGHRALEHGRTNQDEGVIYAVGAKSGGYNDQGSGLWPRGGTTCTSKQRQERSISTGRGRGAGETETEPDEPPRHLPTSRRIPTPPPLAPLTPLARVTPLLFQTFRLLSVVPAFAGVCYHLLNLHQPQGPHSRLDHLVCLLWALLTAHQCLRLTTGLLTRWKAYYPPLPTLIRLLALQAICWPATQYTLLLFNHDRRPVVCWAVIGTTTCVSRSIQIWVTSNLWGPSKNRHESNGSDIAGIKWGPRRWDWTEVGITCALPMGVVYFVMAWAEALRRELSGC